MEGGNVFIEPLGRVDFPWVCGEPVRSIRSWSGLFQDP
jgi:hypothetical protein